MAFARWVTLGALFHAICVALPASNGSGSGSDSGISSQDVQVLDLSTVPWTVESSSLNVSVPAKIPSQVHLDLLAAGIIQEPTYGDNDEQQKWIALGNFTYKTAALPNLRKSADTETQLIFDGLDTFADIFFCDAHVGSVNNQFQQWSFNVTEELLACQSGDPSIRIAFNSSIPISTALAQSATEAQGKACVTCFATSFQFPGRQFIRKEQSDYGWDWGPGFAPQGIWQPARIVQVPKSIGKISAQNAYIDVYRLGQVNNLPPDQSAPWVLNASIDYVGELADGASMAIEVRDNSGAVLEVLRPADVKVEAGKVTGSSQLSKQPDLWWPAGKGSQALYNVCVTVNTDSQSNATISVEKRIGFRTIVLNQTPITAAQEEEGIAPGNNWHFEINGHEIYAKGSNLIPPDPFWPRVTREQVDILFSSAIAANHNMLRVWSSNVYLPDYVYDLADEYGLLLWSEFQFSDSFYPNDPASLESYTKEAAQQVRRVNHHPSLALWCGGNELELALQLVLLSAAPLYPAALSNFESIFLDALVHAVFDNTRSITYIASSTNSGYESFDYNRSRPIKERYTTAAPGIPGIGPIYGNSDYYNYDVTQAFKSSAYPVSRFTNEFGFPSHSSYATYSASIPKDQLSFNSSILLHRNRHYPIDLSSLGKTPDPGAPPPNTTEMSLGGTGQMSQGATLYYPTPNNTDPAALFSLQIYATQLFQAELVRSQIDFYRRGSGLRQRNLGSLYWQLNDIWASPTWASLEVGGRWKALHHVAGDAYEPVVIAPYIDDFGGISASVTSDLWQDVSGEASLTWYDWAGNQIRPEGDGNSTNYGNCTSTSNSRHDNWSFADRSVSVGAIHSTQIWQQNLLTLPHELKTAVAVLRVNVSVTNQAEGASEKTWYTAERFFTPAEHLSNAETINAIKQQQQQQGPNLSVHYDAAADSFVVTSTGLAAFVWLEPALDDCGGDGKDSSSPKGHFSRNAFWMLPGTQTVKFVPFSSAPASASASTAPPGWQSRVTVKSVWDLIAS